MRDVLDEACRLQWSFVPFESVGPIRFGMSCIELEAAIGQDVRVFGLRRLPHGVTGRTLELVRSGPRLFVADVYSTGSDQVFCVAVNGRSGPQVALGGVRLVGRVPSEVEAEFIDYATANDAGARYSVSNDPAAVALGVVLCVQRAGDVVVSRPVFVGREWGHMFWDRSESCIPDVEWPQIYS